MKVAYCLTFLKSLILLCGDVEENPGPVDHIGRAFIIDFLGSTKSLGISRRLHELGLEIKTDIRNIQSGSSCGYNAASIIAKIDFLHRTKGSWWNAAFDDCVYSSLTSSANLDMIKRENQFLGRSGANPYWLSGTEVVNLIGFYKWFFNYKPADSTHEDIYEWIADPQGASQFDRTVEKIIRKYQTTL